MRRLLAISFSLCLSFASVDLALAKEKPKKGGDKGNKNEEIMWNSFKALDKNSDGKLSLEEFTADGQSDEAKQQFKKLDTDGDGLLSFVEFKGGKIADKRAKKPKK
jgi:Ca2+-binding EF-hand superfamily protein